MEANWHGGRLASGDRLRLPSWPAPAAALLLAWLLLLSGFAASEDAAGLFTNQEANPNTLSTATLQPPASVTVGNEQSTSLDVSWPASTSDFVTGYELYRSETSGGPYGLVQSFGAGTLSHTDGGLTPATTYYYVVRAIAHNWTSADSPEGSSTTAP